MDLSQMALAEIKRVLAENRDGITPQLRLALSQDTRAGVKKLYQQLCRQEALEEQEIIRLKKLQLYEEDVRRKGITLIAGIDEAGRGPLAGPVVASAVILPSDVLIRGVNDSKKLTAAKREQLYEEITEKAVSWSVGVSTVEEIDALNILRASLLAMNRAVAGLNPQPEYLLVDAVEIPNVKMPQLPIIKGDGLSISIAAASIIAKVTRDRMMDEYDVDMPFYGFARHKGYGTGDHIKALMEHGPSPLHRTTFIKKILVSDRATGII